MINKNRNLHPRYTIFSVCILLGILLLLYRLGYLSLPSSWVHIPYPKYKKEPTTTDSPFSSLSIPFSQLHHWHTYRRNIRHPLRIDPVSSPLSSTSSLHCTGSLQDYSGTTYRSCVLKNVCYNNEKNEWLYYVGNGKQTNNEAMNKESSSSSTSIFAIPVRFDSDFGMVSSLSYRKNGIVSDTMEIQDHRYPVRDSLQPHIKLDPYPYHHRSSLSIRRNHTDNNNNNYDNSRRSMEITQMIQLWYPNQHLFYDCNIGHLLWDWSTSLLYNRLVLGIGNNNIWKGMGDTEYRNRVSRRLLPNETEGTKLSSQSESINRLRRTTSVSSSFSTVSTMDESSRDDISVLLTEEFPRFSHVPDALGLEHPLCRKTIPVIQPAHQINTVKHALENLGRSYGDGKPLNEICFRNIAVGGYHYHIQPFPAAQGYSITNLGQDSHFIAYRNSILTTHGLDPSISLPSMHQIVLLKKSASFSNGQQTVRRSIDNLDEAYEWLQKAFPSLDQLNRIQIMEPHKQSWSNQLQIYLSTSILITPCGGISTILPFLPFGATVIVMDYPEPSQNRSVSMESILWNHFPYLHILYYQMYSTDDYRIMDINDIMDNGQINYRQNTVNILQRTRLLSLVYSAMKYMA